MKQYTLELTAAELKLIRIALIDKANMIDKGIKSKCVLDQNYTSNDCDLLYNKLYNEIYKKES